MSYPFGNQFSAGMPNAKYKTTLCRHYQATRQCAIGAKCQFAHGQEEMRSINDPIPTALITVLTVAPPYQEIMKPMMPQQPGFKIPCKYHAQNYCKNGQNCQYSHDVDIQQPMIPNMINPYQPQYPQIDMRQEIKQEDPMTTVFIIILQTMEQIFSKDDIIQKLKIAQDQVKCGNLTVGSECIKNIMTDPERTDDEIEQYTTIYNNACYYYHQLQQG
ncbi:unnamed protein product [Paramecium sonneborni]|uniref:C3H1-type domain-containing protein n=1 Tax=Paramecium sonneborni TaxID=65129 RepID=A0A8S1NLJ2_9CILI|nr:unnamed protein product [Paramecium sonneborni]